MNSFRLIVMLLSIDITLHLPDCCGVNPVGISHLKDGTNLSLKP